MTRVPDRLYGVFVGIVVGVPLLVAFLLAFFAAGGAGTPADRAVAFMGSIVALALTVGLWLHYLNTTGRPGGFR